MNLERVREGYQIYDQMHVQNTVHGTLRELIKYFKEKCMSLRMTNTGMFNYF